MPFYFAWCGADEAFDSSHEREDETVFAFDLAHQEGQIPTLNIDIKNPHIGLLAPGRSQWAWLSYDDGSTVYPLFYGRLVALPSNLLDEVVTLEFVARPIDFLAQKQSIADSMMVEPYYDPIWIDQTKLDDPDTVLETYAMAWHVDRTSHEVSVSDILAGEDGTEEFQEGDSFYDSVKISFAQSPQTQVVFDGTVQWTQTNAGYIAMPAVSFIAWNGDQIMNDWPKPGDKLDGGWSIYDASITNWADGSAANSPFIITVGGDTAPNVTPSTPPKNQAGNIGGGDLGDTGGVTSQMPMSSPTGGGPVSWSISVHSDSKHHQDGDVIGFSESMSYDAQGGWGGTLKSISTSISKTDTGVSSYSQSLSWERLIGSPQTAPATTPRTPIVIDGGGNTSGGDAITIPSLYGQMILQYDLNFPRIETIHFVMNSQVQPIVLLPPDEPANQIKLSMHGADLGLPIDPGTAGTAPIGDPGRSAFFPTDRGLQAVQYPLLVARAHLMQAARAAKINFDCAFERAIDLSCRKNALLHDPRLPGGQVIGKITEYHLKADGDNGQLLGEVQIESAIGTGVPITVRTGSPTYVDEGYMDVGYQFYSDADLELPNGDGIIEMPPTYFDPTQMRLPLTFNDAVVAFQVHEGTPIDVIAAGGAAATADPTWLEIVLNPVTGQRYQNDYDLGASTLALPKLIDLAAPSA